MHCSSLDSENNFAGRMREMNLCSCNARGVAIFDFPDKGTVNYLKNQSATVVSRGYV